MKRWLLSPGGWSMPLCEIDLPSRLVSTEKFDEAWYPGEAVNEMVFADLGGRTLMTLTIRYESKEARDAALKSGMDEGMAIGYDNLERMLANPGS